MNEKGLEISPSITKILLRAKNKITSLHSIDADVMQIIFSNEEKCFHNWQLVDIKQVLDVVSNSIDNNPRPRY